MGRKHLVLLFTIILCSAIQAQKATRGLMVDRLEALVCDEKGRADLLQFSKTNQVNTLYLYISELWFTENPGLLDEIMAFYHTHGIEIYGVVSPSSYEPLSLRTYANRLTSLDGIFVEYEFWNMNQPFWKFKRFMRTLNAMLPKMTVMNYIGWPANRYTKTVRRLKFMQQFGDEIAVHLYRKDIDLDFIRNRLLALDDVGKTNGGVVNVAILYSTEPSFMMDKLEGSTLATVHSEFIKGYEKNLRFPNINVTGWVWFKASDVVGY